MSLGAFAISPKHHQEDGNDIRNVAHDAFEDNAPDDLKDAVPKFAVFGVPGKFYIGLGGTIKLTAGVDAATRFRIPMSW